MADWNNVQPDEYKLLGKNYSSGRPYGIDCITLHHMAGDLDADQCNGVWAKSGASAHYSIDRNGKIVQHVHDNDRAYACGDGVGRNSGGNDRSISIEHANSGSNPWTVHDAAIESGAHLVAALCKFYELGRPEWMKNVFPHSHWSATACPGELAGSQNAAYMKRAQEWYDAMCDGSAQAPQPSQPQGVQGSTDDLARRVIAGEFGTGEARKAALGSRYSEVQARVNEMLGAGSSAPQQTPDIDQLARDVIAGKYGTGEARKKALGSNYSAVQARVNQMLGVGGSSAPAVNIDDLARRVIAGEFGNGEERKRRLGSNYEAVQRRVNQLL